MMVEVIIMLGFQCFLDFQNGHVMMSLANRLQAGPVYSIGNVGMCLRPLPRRQPPNHKKRKQLKQDFLLVNVFLIKELYDIYHHIIDQSI